MRDADGQPQRIVGASFDVEQRRRRDDRLALVSRLQVIAVSLSTALLRAHKLDDPDTITRSISAIGEAVGANSVVVSRIEGGVVSVLHDWRAPGVEPLDPALLAMPEAQVEPFLGPMRGGEPLALGADQPMTPVQRAFLDRFGIDGVVAAPIAVRGRLAGILTTGLPASDVQIDDLVRPLQLMADAVGAGWQHQEDEQQLRQLNARLAHTNERQDALLALSATLARAIDREALLEATRAQLLDILGLDAASLFEIMPDGRFTLTALDRPRPRPADAAPFVDAIAPPFDAGPVVVLDPPLLDGSAIVEAMRCGRSVSTLEHAADTFTDWRLLIEHDDLRCFAVVPLVTSAGAIGTLNIAHRAPGSMTEGELRWIEQIAAIIAAQLAIRRGQADLRDLNASLEARVTERTAELRTTRDQLTAALAQAGASVREKETLLQEVHHRVKNNLQIISSMLTLQTDQTRDPDARALLDASADRVRSMALIHQQLYSSVTLAQVDFGSYTERLARRLCASLAPDTLLKVSVTPVALPVDRAVPLGLVVNELVTNALKHGRGADGRCVLRLSVAQTETDLILTVADEGPGLPEGLPTLDGSSLGWTLVHALVRQVHGGVEIVDGEGAVFRLRVPLGTTDD